MKARMMQTKHGVILTTLCLSILAARAWAFAQTQVTYYVNLNNPNPAPPYTSWATAATNIQDAVKAGSELGRLVLVTNGVYRTGSVDGNRVALTNAVILRSVNGPELTVIQGAPYHEKACVRCVFAVTNAVISGFTLTNGAGGDGWGGGAYGGTLTNCTLAGNSARTGGGGAYGCTLYNCTVSGNGISVTGPDNVSGGGVAYCTLYNCTVTRNSGGGAVNSTLYNCTLTLNSVFSFNLGPGGGGGASHCTLYNCTVARNSSDVWLMGRPVYPGPGGGVLDSTLYNCIVYDNKDANDYYNSTFSYSCTSPLPPGVGNMDADPHFVNAAAGDFRLRPESPCLDAGTNLIDLVTTDLLGVLRPLDGNGDGAAELGRRHGLL